MKNAIFFMILFVLTFSVLAINSKAQSNKSDEYSVNLIAGLNSENEGLVKSSIYFSGKYKMTESVESLIKIMKKSDRNDMKILAAHALYEIGDLRGLSAIGELAETEDNSFVREECRTLYSKFLRSEIVQFADF